MKPHSSLIDLIGLDGLEKLQKFQERFYLATGFPNAYIDAAGNYVSKAGEAAHICMNIIRENEKGRKRCIANDIRLTKAAGEKGALRIYKCHAGIWDASVPIIVEGENLGFIFIGQCLTESPNKAEATSYAKELGIDPVSYWESYKLLPIVTYEKIEQVASLLFFMASVFSEEVSGKIRARLETTELKRTEVALRKSEATLKSIFKAAPIGIGLVRTRIFKEVNDRLCKMVGYSRNELLDKNARIIYPTDEDYEYVGREKYRQICETGTGAVETRFQHKNGNVLNVLLSSAQLNPDDLSEGAVFTALDITDRKRAEEALQEAYSIINRSPAVAFLWKNLEGWPVEFVSDNVMELFGYAAEEFTSGQVPYAKTVHPDDLERVAKEVTTFSNEKERTGFVHEPYRIISKDGKVRWLDDRTYIRRDNKGNITHYEGIVVDITDSMQAAEALRENKEKLARSKKMESLGLLAGGVAHDLNNVLSGIVSYPELLLLQLPEDSQFRKAIETIKESGDRAVAIVKDLLTVARGVATTKKPLNLNDLIGDYLNSPEFNKLKQFHPTVTVKTNLDTDLLNISGSHVHIRKVVMNLVSNASEAIKGSGNVTLSTVNRYVDKPLRAYDDINAGEYAVLAVSDDGSGISSDDLERVFEPFYTKKVMGRSGTGLGLAVVWNVVQDHKSYIDVTTDENGTTFELYFPITRDEVSDKDLSVPINDFKGNEETILIIDDVESQRDISCKMLDTLGYKTKAVSSGEEAVEYLKEHSVDLILLDMIMDPGINGRETYERIIKIHPNQKAIIVSGFAETDEVKETQKLGAGKFINKPLTLERIGLDIKEELGK